jgi:hypothetical protein
MSGMKKAWLLLVLLVPVLVCAQTAADSKAAVLANTHGRVHDLIADMFGRDNATLEHWESDPSRIPHADEMCTTGERAALQALASNVRALNSLPAAEADSQQKQYESEALRAAFRLETYQPATHDQLKKTLAAASAGNTSSQDAELKNLDQPAPAQIEVSREDLLCHFVPIPGAAEPTRDAGPTYEVVISKDGKTKSAKPYKISGEVLTWQMAARRVRYRPFYFMGEPVEATGFVTFKINTR